MKSTLDWKRFALLLLIFAITVGIRIPNLNRPLSKHHEFVTAVSLRVLQIWEKEGGAKYNFTPVMNYPGRENKYINNHASPTEEMVDDAGNYYYVSHPPLAYILPHAVFTVLQIKPTVLSLQIFHLFIHFFSAIFVYLITLLVVKRKGLEREHRTGVIAFVIYCFTPATLWFQSNTYMSDMFVQLFFLAAAYLVMLKMEKPHNKWAGWVLAIVVFLGVYTTWFMVIVAGSIGLFALIQKDRSLRILIPFLMVSVVLALLLTYWQYSSIAGSEAFLSQLGQRFAVRGSNSSEATGGFGWVKLNEIVGIAKNYVFNYLPLLLLLLVGVFTKRVLINWRGELFWIAVLPFLILHIGLSNYSQHDFTVLYAALVISILSALVLMKLHDKISRITLVGIVLSAIAMYYYINRPGEYSWKGDRYADSMDVGLKINRMASDNEWVVLITDELDPMTVVYAQRNIISVHSQKELNETVRRNVGKRLRIFNDKNKATE